MKANSVPQQPAFWLAPMAVLLWVMANTIAILPGKAFAGTANVDQVEMSLADMEVQINGVLQTAGVEAMSGRSAAAKVKLLSVLEKAKSKFGANGEVTIRIMEGLAQVCTLSGDLEEAGKYYQIIYGAKKIKYGNESEEVLFALSDIANAQFQLRNFEAAEMHISKFIKGAEVKLGKDHVEILRAKENYAATLINVKKYQSAILAYDELVAIYKENNDQNGLKRARSGRLLALAGVGDVQKITAELNGNQQLCKWTGNALDFDGIDSAITCLMLSSKSEEHLNLANVIYNSVKGKVGFEPQQLKLLYIIAKGNFNGGKVALMSNAIGDFVDISENIRTRSTTSSEQRRVLFSDFSNDYQTFADWYARKHELISAFNLGDLSKARTLTDSIKAKSALQSLSVIEQNQLQSLENRAEDLQKQFHFQVQSGKSPTETETLLALQKQQQQIKQQYASFQNQLKAKYPKYAQLTDIKQVTADAAKALLQPGEAFVSYLVRQSGEAQVFVLDQRGSPRWVDLDDLSNLDKTVAASRELILFTQGNSLQGKLVALKDGRGYQWLFPGQAMPAGADAAATTPAAAQKILNAYWYEKLIKPILPLAGGYSRWIISPDKDLALLPFDTLPEVMDADGRVAKTLAQTRNLTLVQSFAVYALLKQRESDYAQLQRPKELFAMGNAIYSDGWAENRGLTRGSGERRYTQRNAKLIASESDVTSNTISNGNSTPLKPAAEQFNIDQLEWKNLPGTAREVKAVSAVFNTNHSTKGSGSSGGADSYLGKDASEGKLQQLNESGKLKDYRYLLFSAHGYLAQNPALSSLVLSLKGNPPGIDGYVTASEWPLYDVKSDLTVLSACDTGVGKIQAGEGVMGLPYALFVAGNKNTLMTLWPVDDNATAEFMSSFFSKLKAGQNHPGALFLTKQEFMRHPQYSHPRYWAAFVLYGV